MYNGVAEEFYILWCERYKIFSDFIFFPILLGLLDGQISQRIVYRNQGGLGLGCGGFTYG